MSNLKLPDDAEEIRKLEFIAEEKWSSDKGWTAIDTGTAFHQAVEVILSHIGTVPVMYVGKGNYGIGIVEDYAGDFKKLEDMTVDILGSGFIGEIDHITIHQIEVDPYTEYGVKPKTKTPHHVKPWKNKRYF